VPTFNTATTSVLLTAGAADTHHRARGDRARPNVGVPAGAVVYRGGQQTPNSEPAAAHDNCSSCVVIVRTGVPAGNVFPGRNDERPRTPPAMATANSAAAIQTRDRPPTARRLRSPPPADITVTARPPVARAVVNPGTPIRLRSHAPASTVTSSRSDGQPLGAPFPLGTTTITWTAHRRPRTTSASATQHIIVKRAARLVIGGGIANPIRPLAAQSQEW